MPMKTKLALMFISAILISTATTQLIDYTAANPFRYGGTVPAPEGIESPTISVYSPTNNSIFASSSISFAFDVVESNETDLKNACYEVDWKEGNISVLPFEKRTPEGWLIEHSYSGHLEDLNGIPDGTHSIHIHANASGIAYAEVRNGLIYQYVYYVSSSSLVYFTVDTTSPRVSILSPENRTYTNSDLPLSVSTNEEFSEISYVLDGLQNVSINGNATLTQLAYGEHNITVHSTDLAGNEGTSETITFTIEEPFVEEPFPTSLVIGASGTSVAVAAVGLLVYFKKRKHRKTLSSTTLKNNP